MHIPAARRRLLLVPATLLLVAMGAGLAVMGPAFLLVWAGVAWMLASYLLEQVELPARERARMRQAARDRHWREAAAILRDR